ncbi:MAG TPA: alkaline phosphatase, partial [Myxococcota bacterium]|nr:alkaline phosphatase [Myxococcota bacterium]
MKKWSLIVLMLSFCSCKSVDKKLETSLKAGAAVPKNIILLIADGMGFEYVKAARIFNGQKPLSFENFPCQTRVNTCSFAGADQNGRCLKDTKD